MNQKWSRKSFKDFQTAYWLIGLGILFLLKAWWPGILILIGLDLVLQALLPAEEEALPPRAAPVHKPEVEEVVPPGDALGDPVPPPIEVPFSVPAETLPVECPACGGPLRENAQAVQAVEAEKVVCPFCNARVSLL